MNKHISGIIFQFHLKSYFSKFLPAGNQRALPLPAHTTESKSERRHSINLKFDIQMARKKNQW